MFQCFLFPLGTSTTARQNLSYAMLGWPFYTAEATYTTRVVSNYFCLESVNTTIRTEPSIIQLKEILSVKCPFDRNINVQLFYIDFIEK